MSTYGPPMCYRCNNFKTYPERIGDQGTCSVYPNGIPRKIFFQSGDCNNVSTNDPTNNREKAEVLQMSLVEVKSSGEILPKTGMNTRTPYEHQKIAMALLDKMNNYSSYSTLLVLPTGGGKTYTASNWLLKNAINRKKKVLWIAHRHMLLDQAAESFQKFAYTELIPHISSFRFRIVSGLSQHDRTINIVPTDDLLIASKDSIGRNLGRLDSWLKGENELYLIVDEAHHSPSKTYRRVIDYVKRKVPSVKLIGLTATPFRTAESEQGLLAKIYTDGITNGQVVRNDIGIAYQISLKELINRQILSKPIFESYDTDEEYGESLGLDAMESIQHLDTLPYDLAKKLAESTARNRLIVDTYCKKKSEYGKTIVFAVNIDHAIQLNTIFNKAGVKARYIVSSIKDAITGVTISGEENKENIDAFRDGDLDVLINVNILTEGIDLPRTKTVFLARPTVSTILMTQMVGRALRGTKAGGTDDAYIVSFVDNWKQHIAWVNPESLFEGNNEFVDNETDRIKQELRMISISKIEEFASLLDDTIDTSKLEIVSFMKRIPLGMYAFTYLEEDGMDLSYQVMVYDSTHEAYRDLMESLPALFGSFKTSDEYLSSDLLDSMQKHCHDTFFCGEMIPAYDKRDVVNILKYYAQYETAPQFYTFDQIDKDRLDVAKIAQHIWDEDMGERKKAEYINTLWDSSDDNMLRLFFGRKTHFRRQLDIELTKIAHGIEVDKNNVIPDAKKPEVMTLGEIRKFFPDLEKELRDGAFEKSKTIAREYQCAHCGLSNRSRVPFQVDHIIPMNKGGKSIPENLQILCRSCNAIKGDK